MKRMLTLLGLFSLLFLTSSFLIQCSHADSPYGSCKCKRLKK